MKATLGELLTGPAGTAQRVHIELGRRDPANWSATLASWFLTCPGQSVAWDRYALHAIHLRPVQGGRDAVITVPGATHEVLLVALDPRGRPRPERPRSWQFLRPVNLTEQVQLPDDEAAVDLVRTCAEAVVDGVLWAEPPLSGQLEPWRTMLIQTAAHGRGEPHGDISAAEPQP